MAKEHEKNYYSRLSEEGRQHSDGKPYTDEECGELLMGVGQIITLLPPPGARVLDLGCGTGWTSEFYARAGYVVTGLDISSEMLRVAARLRPFRTLSFVVGDYERLPASKAFDAIVSFGALHHSENLSAALLSCFQALGPGGVFIIMEPGEGHAESESSIRCATEYGTTEKSLPPELLRSELRTAGFREVEVVPWLGHFSSSLITPMEQKNWKYKLVSKMIGDQMANSLQLYSMTRKCAIVRARKE